MMADTDDVPLLTQCEGLVSGRLGDGVRGERVRIGVSGPTRCILLMNEGWDLRDFLGKYHRHRIAARYPIGGTAVAVDEERRRARPLAPKQRIEKVTRRDNEWALEMEARLGGTLAKVGRVLEARSYELGETPRQVVDARSRELVDDEKTFEAEREVRSKTDGEAAARAALVRQSDDVKWRAHVVDGNVDGMEAMVKSGYDRLDAEPPALHVSVRRGQVAAVKLLCEHGVDVNAENEYGDVALLLAWAFWDAGHATACKTLKDDTARQRALGHEEATVTILRLLLSHGARAHASRADGTTALHEAARRGPVRAVKALLHYGANDDVTVRRIAEDRLKKDECDDARESARLLRQWKNIKHELKYDEFLQEWWTALKTGASLGSEPSRVLENAQLDMAQRRLALSLKTHKYGAPFWTYDEVRRTVCCGDESASGLEAFLQDWSWTHQQPPPNELRFKRQPRRKNSRTRPASTDPLSIPLDKYLKGEVAPDFIERRPTVTRSEKEIILKKLEERAAERRRSKQRYQNDPLLSKLEQRRSRAARAILDDARNEGLYDRSAWASSFLTQRVKRQPAPSSDASIAAELVELRNYGGVPGVRHSFDDGDNDQSLEKPPMGLERGTAHRHAAAAARRLNDLDHLPPEEKKQTEAKRKRSAVVTFPWAYHPPNETGAPDADYWSQDRHRQHNAASLIATTEYACDLEQRPRVAQRALLEK